MYKRQIITDLCTATANASVTVGSVSPPTASIAPTAPICVGGSVTLTCNAPGATSYLWSGAAPVGGSTTPAVTINSLTAANNGTYSVVASNGGCPSAPANYALNVNPNPALTGPTATPNPVCSGSNTQLNALATVSGYAVAPIAYAPVSGTGIAGPVGDDVVGGPYTIPFPFTFYGTSFTAAYVSTCLLYTSPSPRD